MSIIENFAVLPVQEQLKFANALVKTINSEKIFSDDTKFEVHAVTVEDVTGGLAVAVSLANPIEISREATWTCGSADDAENDPGTEATYYNGIFDDARSAFKVIRTEIDGYSVALEVDDVDLLDGDPEIEVARINNEDSGVGSNEYFGVTDFDSRPYVEVEGTITKSYDCALTFYVEPTE